MSNLDSRGKKRKVNPLVFPIIGSMHGKAFDENLNPTNIFSANKVWENAI